MLPRHRKFLEALPKHGNKVLPSAIEAGYTESYARKGGKRLYEVAIKAQAREVIEMVENKSITNKQASQMMSDIVGLSREDIMLNLKKIATQDKDYSTALKVLSALAREHGVQMNTEETKVTVPILNVTTSNHGSIEPPIQDTTV